MLTLNTFLRLVSITAPPVLLWVALAPVSAQKSQFNYDESRVPVYRLPDPLLAADGTRIATAADWWARRRPEIVKSFEEQVYGRAPGRPERMTFQVRSVDRQALDGQAIRKQVAIHIPGKKDGPLELLIYLPGKASKPVPVFLGLNFGGNHSIQDDPEILLSKQWMRSNKGRGVVNNRATEASRGTAASRWPVRQIVDRGFAVATIYCGDIDPDFHDEFQNGVHPAFYRSGQTRPAAGEWGTIAAWAWGLSRGLDYFESDPDIDHQHTAVMGHSRLGKTALWAGAIDQRFALVVSNNSGCGGAALSRRRFGETVKRINTSFPHWFNANFKKYNDQEDQLPVDQHELVALIAPRPVLICSARQDRWADPRGEYLSGLAADSVYRLLGTDGVGARSMPAVNQAPRGTIGYRIRPGKHDVTAADWDAYLDFAHRHFGTQKQK